MHLPVATTGSKVFMYTLGTGNMPVLSSSWLISSILQVLEDVRCFHGIAKRQPVALTILARTCVPAHDAMTVVACRIQDSAIHLSLPSRITACLAKSRRFHIDSSNRGVSTVGFDTTPSGATSILFSTLKEPSIACLSKTQATMSLHTGTSHSVRGRCLGFRPAFSSECDFFENMTNIRTHKPLVPKVRGMKIRVVRRVVE
jgi:hypothetical protein